MKRNSLPHDHVLLVCAGGACADKKAKKLQTALKKGAKERGLDVHVNQTRCLKNCGDGPHVLVSPGKTTFSGVKPKDVNKILDTLRGKK